MSNHDVRGRFAQGNNASVKTGFQAGKADLPSVLQVLEARVETFLAQSLADDGGAEDMPARRRSQHEYRAVMHLTIMRLNAAIELHSLFDRRGRLRVHWLQRLESAIRTATSIDDTLGLARQKQV